MGKEIERKYLVDLTAWKPLDEGIHFKQIPYDIKAR